MKLGVEDKRKTAAAAALGLVAVVTVYVQFFTGSPASPPRRPAAATKAAAAEVRPTRQTPRQTAPATNRGGDFEPVWSRLSEDPSFDPVETDPTVRTDLLAAVRGVEFERIERNLFAFTDRKRKPEPGPTAEDQAAAQALIDQQKKQPAKVVPPAAPAPPVKPRAPQLTWKYYGFAAESTQANRRAFLLDGEDVMIGAEGDVFKDRYRIVRIGLTSIVIEDIQFKAEQTLAITYQPG